MKERKNNYYKERLRGERDIFGECNPCIPNIETEIENLMKELYITRYDYKVTHLLADLVQAEVVKILKKTKSIKKERENNIKYDWKDKWSQMKSVRFENKENNQNEKGERETQKEKGTEKEETRKRKEEAEGEINTSNTNNSTHNHTQIEKPNDKKEEPQKKEEKEGEIKEENSKQINSNTDIDPNVKNKNNETETINKEEEKKEETTNNMQINKEQNSTNIKKEEDKKENIELSIKENEHKEEERDDPPNSLNKTETEKDIEKQQHNKELEELLYVDDISVKLAIREYVLQNINRKKNVDFLYQDHHTANKCNEETSLIVERNINYPNSLPPYLPDDCSVNTILPSWDLNYVPNGLKK